MEKQTQEQEREGTYRQIYSEIQRLSSEADGAAVPKRFDEYLVTLNSVQVKYIQEFDQMSPIERQEASLLIGMVQNQIHSRLDIFRARAMRRELVPKK